MLIITKKSKKDSIAFFNETHEMGTLLLKRLSNKFQLKIGKDVILISSDGIINQEFFGVNTTTHYKWEYFIPNVKNLLFGAKRILKYKESEFLTIQKGDKMTIFKDDMKIGSAKRKKKHLFFVSYYEIEVTKKYLTPIILAASILILGIEKFGWLDNAD